MRKATKAFVTEYRGGKRSSGLPKPRALFDDSNIFSTDEKPPRDLNDEREASEGGYEAALRAADALFSKPALMLAQDQAGASTAPEKRVLADLSYHDPLAERLAAAGAVRRGRKPGTKNRPKAPSETIPAIGVASAPANVSFANPAPFIRAVRSQAVIGYRDKILLRKALQPGERWKARAMRLYR